MNLLSAKEAIAIFRQSIADYHIQDHVDATFSNPFSAESLEGLLYHKNWIDTVQWHLEDIIRNPEISTETFIGTKRRIDGSNQDRTDTVERIDDMFLKVFAETPLEKGARQNSETPAWLLDRLSILELKIYHFGEQVERKDTDEHHHKNVAAKLGVLVEQEKDLSICFNELMLDLSNGKKYMKAYKQMKMYNDPKLNPELYRKK